MFLVALAVTIIPNTRFQFNSISYSNMSFKGNSWLELEKAKLNVEARVEKYCPSVGNNGRNYYFLLYFEIVTHINCANFSAEV